MAARPDQPEAFLRGVAFPGTEAVPYPRADPADAIRLPLDTWSTARLPVGVRIEFVGDAPAVTIAYRTATDRLGYRGGGAGTTFALWRADTLVDEQPAVLGDGVVHLDTSVRGTGPAVPAVVYLPEGMQPTVLAVTATNGGSVRPAPTRPRWVAYGDSIVEGWIATAPAHAWPAAAARRFSLDVVNMGYAGAARGEIASAEQVASLPADVISITHGTNCWTRVPHSAGMMREATAAFLEIVRQGHPTTPIVVATPVIRPDAETTPNRLGATLGDLRDAMAAAVQSRIDAGDDRLVLVHGAGLLEARHLADGIHPGDEGHRILAEVLGRAVSQAFSVTGERKVG